MLEELHAVSSEQAMDHSEGNLLQRGLDSCDPRKGLLLFFVVTIAALALLFILTDPANALEAFADYNLKYMVLTILLLFFDVFLGAWRNHYFMRRLARSTRFITSLRANLANTFMGAITPSQSGGGPAQLYIYCNSGASAGHVLFVSAFNYLSTLVVFISGAALAMALLPGRFGSRYTPVIIVCFVVFSIQFVLLTLALKRPELFSGLIERVSHGLSRLSPRIGNRIGQLAERISFEADAFRNASKLTLKGNWTMFPLSLLFTTLLFLNKYTIAYTVLIGLGVDCNFLAVVAVQALLMCIVYLSPSPGGSGVAEMSIALLMSAIVHESMLGAFAFLQRFFLLYLPLIPGLLIVTAEIRSNAGGRRGSRRKPGAEAGARPEPATCGSIRDVFIGT